MKIFLAALTIFALSFVGMMVGVLLRRRSLQPCSRFASPDGPDASCDLCSRFSQCESEKEGSQFEAN